jgi:hypothetical protein
MHGPQDMGPQTWALRVSDAVVHGMNNVAGL